MRRLLTLSVALALLTLIAPRLYSDDAETVSPPAPPAATTAQNDASAEKTELKAIHLVTGTASLCNDTRCCMAVPIRDLPKEAAFIAAEFQDATFASDGKTLVVGLKVEGREDGEMLAKIGWQADCPNNSTFTAEQAPAIAKEQREQLRNALFAWTKWRHRQQNAPLLKIVRSPKSFDVRLKLASLRQ